MVGKLVVKVVIMVVIMVGMSNYVLYIMTGKTPFSTTSLEGASLPSIPTLPPGKETAYKWTDAQGVVHYSSEPPPEQMADLKKMIVDPNVNLVQGAKPTPKPTPEQNDPQAESAPSLYNPQSVQKLVEDARNVEKLLNDRAKAQEDIINSH